MKLSFLNQYLRAVQGLFRAATQPQTYFSGTRGDELKRNAWTGMGVTLLAATILLFLISWAFRGPERAAQEGLWQQLSNSSAEYKGGVVGGTIPFRQLLFPAYWMIIIGFLAGVRYLMTILLGESNRSFSRIAWITTHSVFVVLLLSVCYVIAGQIAPISILATPSAGQVWRVRIMLMILFLGWVVEAYISTSAFKTVVSANGGRAWIAVVSPWLLGFLFIVLIMIVGSLG